MSHTRTPTEAVSTASTARTRRSRWFYVGVSGVLLLVVLLGFSQSFFLRSFFTERPLLPYLYVHGTLLTLWFSLVFAQACLVAAHRTDLHRRLGVAGVVNAAVLVPISAMVVIRAIPRYIAGGMVPAEIQFIVIGDLISLVVFSVLIIGAVTWRRRPEWHKRLMAVASIIIVGPAVARLERAGLPLPVPAVLLLLLAALLVHDAATLRRLHQATVLSSLLVLVSLGALFLLVGSATGQSVIEFLGQT
jgi:hypothetical protein